MHAPIYMRGIVSIWSRVSCDLSTIYIHCIDTQMSSRKWENDCIPETVWQSKLHLNIRLNYAVVGLEWRINMAVAAKQLKKVVMFQPPIQMRLIFSNNVLRQKSCYEIVVWRVRRASVVQLVQFENSNWKVELKLTSEVRSAYALSPYVVNRQKAGHKIFKDHLPLKKGLFLIVILMIYNTATPYVWYIALMILIIYYRSIRSFSIIGRLVFSFFIPFSVFLIVYNVTVTTDLWIPHYI